VILCDSGPIFAVADRNDADHRACVDLFTGLRLANRRLLVPQTVVAEVGYLLETKVGTFAEVAFLEALAYGDFELVDLLSEDLARMAELVDRYKNLPLGTTDASVIALAERLGVQEVATLDHRHFRTVRPNHIDAFALLPEFSR
jgi:predicted nucleic acid-binding protein